ncbi:MAG: ATP-grasp domain-containing protein [Burkholderiaceae bacterium]|nr:ATP-grasp domain-containing protein [Burkholderiaceae bacterium]
MGFLTQPRPPAGAAPVTADAAPRVLALFALGFARAAWAARAARGTLRPHYEGFDLFAFPSNARLLAFDIFRFVERLARRYGNAGIDGIVTANEQFGALAAALLGQRLGLPHTDPRAVLACQHKAYFRQRLQQIAPEANVPHWPFPHTLDPQGALGLPLPFYVKPVKATFSVLARRIDSRAALARHLSFSPLERLLIKQLVRPFNDAFRALVGEPLRYAVDAHWLLAEPVLSGAQFNLDGYAYRGQVRVLGCVDEIMYPGTDAFLRFQYPSRLPAAVRARAASILARVLPALGFTHGFFNAEFFYDETRDALTLIEINPRLASQLADLYEKVDGLRVFDMLVELACGRDPAHLPRAAPTAGVAASFVWRTFDGMPPPPPAAAAARAWLARRHPDALLLQYHKRGAALRREFKWLGSHRFATLNLGARDEDELRARYEAICAAFGWPAPY